MKNRTVCISFLLCFLPLSSFAANKVVVVPLGSSAKGTDGQVQYNDNGNTAGAEVYYDQESGSLGIGTTNKSARLVVQGESRIVDTDGNSRLWGQGRKNVSVITQWVSAGDGLEAAISDTPTLWSQTQAGCPSGTWVCSEADIVSKLPDFPSINYSYTFIGCTGIVSEYDQPDLFGWLQDHDTAYSGGRGRRFQDNEIGVVPPMIGSFPLCSYNTVLCCRNAATD